MIMNLEKKHSFMFKKPNNWYKIYFCVLMDEEN